MSASVSQDSGEKTPVTPPNADPEKTVIGPEVDARVDRHTEATESDSAGSDSQNSKWDPKYEVQWDGDDDPDNPRSLPLHRKWLQVLITASTATCVTCCSSEYTSTYDQIMAEFGISLELATAGLSLFVFALGLSPMLFGPMSEFYGRRPIYIISMGLFVVWLVPCAVAPNIQTLLIARFFSGLVGSAFLSVAGGTVGDCFTPQTLQFPMFIFTSAPFLGPIVGPIVGNFINYYTNWRWTFYALIIWSAIQWLLLVIFLPETYHPVLLQNKARRLRKETGNEKWHAAIEKHQRSKTQTIVRSCYRPFLLLSQEPMCLNLCMLSALLLAIIYLFFGAYPLIFGDVHGLNLWQIGLTFVGIGVGMVGAVSSNPIWQRRYLRKVEQYEQETGKKGASEPEFRLMPAVVGGPCCVIGMFWFAFTTYPNIHWIVPILGSVVFGFGVVLVFSGIFTFLVDAYPLYAASALAANSFTRSTAAAAFPLFGIQMYQRLGNQWATALLGFLCLALAPFPYIFYKYGKRIRQRSKFAAGR